MTERETVQALLATEALLTHAGYRRLAALAVGDQRAEQQARHWQVQLIEQAGCWRRQLRAGRAAAA